MKKNGGFVPSVDEIRRVDNSIDEKSAMNAYMHNPDLRDKVDMFHPVVQREKMLDQREKQIALQAFVENRNRAMRQREDLQRNKMAQYKLNADRQKIEAERDRLRQQQVNNFLGVRPIVPIVRLSPYDYRDALQRYHDRKAVKEELRGELRRELLDRKPKKIIIRVVRKPVARPPAKPPAKKPVKKPVKVDNKAKKQPAKKPAKQ